MTKKPRDIPLGFNRRDFKVFQPKRPRELMPIIGTGTGRQNELNPDRDPYHTSTGGSYDVYIHNIEAERARQEARDRKNATIIKEVFKFWFVLPYEIIKSIFNRHSNHIGILHILSIFFWIALLYHAINFYQNPTDLLALAWIGLIIFLSGIVAMIKLIKW